MKRIAASLILIGLLLSGVGAGAQEYCDSVAEFRGAVTFGIDAYKPVFEEADNLPALLDAVEGLRALLGGFVEECRDEADASPVVMPRAEETPSDEPLFNIIPNSTMNLRSCASTDCEKVGQAQGGELMPVYAVEGEWYQVQTDDGLAWIAGWLTTRGPDALIKTEEIHRDENTGCAVVVDGKRGDRDFAIILAGAKNDDVNVDVFRPNESVPLRVQAQLDKTFIDTGDPYILQYYSWRIGWPNGLYRFEISLNDNTSMLAWQMEEGGDYNLHVYCE